MFISPVASQSVGRASGGGLLDSLTGGSSTPKQSDGSVGLFDGVITKAMMGFGIGAGIGMLPFVPGGFIVGGLVGSLVGAGYGIFKNYREIKAIREENAAYLAAMGVQPQTQEQAQALLSGNLAPLQGAPGQTTQQTVPPTQQTVPTTTTQQVLPTTQQTVPTTTTQQTYADPFKGYGSPVTTDPYAAINNANWLVTYDAAQGQYPPTQAGGKSVPDATTPTDAPKQTGEPTQYVWQAPDQDPKTAPPVVTGPPTVGTPPVAPEPPKADTPPAVDDSPLPKQDDTSQTNGGSTPTQDATQCSAATNHDKCPPVVAGAPPVVDLPPTTDIPPVKQGGAPPVATPPVQVPTPDLSVPTKGGATPPPAADDAPAKGGVSQSDEVVQQRKAARRARFEALRAEFRARLKQLHDAYQQATPEQKADIREAAIAERARFHRILAEIHARRALALQRHELVAANGGSPVQQADASTFVKGKAAA